METLIDDLITEAINRYRESNYPTSAVNIFLENYLELHIRFPPSIPPLVRSQYTKIKDQLRACPSIERIIVAEEIRGHGLFNGLIDRLGNEPNVDCVCVSNVSNKDLAAHLSSCEEWRTLDSGPFAAFASFYKTFA